MSGALKSKPHERPDLEVPRNTKHGLREGTASLPPNFIKDRAYPESRVEDRAQ